MISFCTFFLSLLPVGAVIQAMHEIYDKAALKEAHPPHSTFVIVANGEIDISLVKEQPPTCVIVALDGAANAFYKEGLVPHYILGDMDSIEKEAMLHFRSLAVPLVIKEDQNFTDLEKGILFCDEMHAGRILILGALCGMRTDHLLGNLSFLKKYHHPKRGLSIRTRREMIEFLKDQEVCIDAEVGSYFALLGFSEAIAHSHGEGTSPGLKWELHAFPLKLGVSESVCNRIASPRVWIRIEGEALMIRQADLK